MSLPSDSDAPLIAVGEYARLAEARERGLVVTAMELPSWIEREGERWILYVEEGAREAVARELGAFENERVAGPREAVEPAGEKIPTLSLYVAGWLLSGLFFLQQIAPPELVERGVGSSREILRGEWWRVVTALTLHADLPHVAANLATGLLFAAFVIPRLGTGLTWLAIVGGGALGNAINAWGYRGELHDSIGASTACFAALGILVSAELGARWAEPHRRSRWQLVLPLGAGLALLAYLGVGEEGGHVDYMAHCWGFVAGGGIGAAATAARAKERLSPAAQRAAAALAVGIVGGCWWLALR